MSVAALATLAGCAMASRGTAPSQSSGYATTAASTGQEASQGWREQPSMQYSVPGAQSQPVDGVQSLPVPTSPSAAGGVVSPSTGRQPTATVTQPGFAQPPPDNPEGEIARWRMALDAGEASLRSALMASARECREICTAAGNICVAAHEICRLTGDATVASARDVRCARARDACVDAGRRRDQACAVCPPGRG
jgi:hypothetical protein